MAIEIPQNTSILINIKAFYQQHEYPLNFPQTPLQTIAQSWETVPGSWPEKSQFFYFSFFSFELTESSFSDAYP